MDEIKPIETRYKGHRFRSRLEARWAVFFDSLGIKWEYEPEGFELPDGTLYLPDFYLPSEIGNDWYVEIKPERNGCFNELVKCIKFAKHSMKPVMILGNIPDFEIAKNAILYAVIFRYDSWAECIVAENYPLELSHFEFELIQVRGWVMNTKIGGWCGNMTDEDIVKWLVWINRGRNIFKLATGDEVEDAGWAADSLPDEELETLESYEESQRFIAKHIDSYAKARSARFEFGEEG